MTFSCSLDDGNPLDMRAANILKKYALNATFFIPIKNREGRKVLGQSDIRELSHAFEIGSHTFDHCFLKDLSIEDAQYQVLEGKKKLEDILGREVRGFCYPGGKYRKEHTALVKAAHFHYARTTTNLRFDTGDDPFEMPTTFQFYAHDRNVYLRNFIKAGHWMNRHNGLFLALKYDNWIDRLYALFEHSVQHGKVFHLWGHTKDIDELNAWKEFDQFLQHVASTVTASNRLTNEQLAKRSFV
jgi:peptidoglycan/xylan/chitin deacetylase (PgdA/CDA1 family)